MAEPTGGEVRFEGKPVRDWDRFPYAVKIPTLLSYTQPNPTQCRELGARHISGNAGVMWGRLAACAAVGYRRCPVQTRQLAD